MCISSQQNTEAGIYSNYKSAKEIARRIKAFNHKTGDRKERVGPSKVYKDINDLKSKVSKPVLKMLFYLFYRALNCLINMFIALCLQAVTFASTSIYRDMLYELFIEIIV